MRLRTGAAVVGACALLISLNSASADGTYSDHDQSGFFLGGTAQIAEDPENPANDVIRIDTGAAPFFGTVSRRVSAKIHQLDNMLSFKAWFQGTKTCIGGAPRLQLAIDLNGDGEPEGNAHGYFGPSPSFAGCPPNTWLFEDLTGGGDTVTGLGPLPSTGQATPNEEAEWDLTQFVCPVTVPPTLPPGPPDAPCIAHPGFVTTWSAVETIIGAFPDHVVCTVALVDDTFGAPGMTGVAYYDLFTAGRATWENHDDTAGRGFARGCVPQDHDDDEHDGDKDCDHDVDDKDEKYDRDRRERWGRDD
jgi:hypothetical protein